MQDINFDEFNDEPTAEIPLETMHQLVYGEGHAPVGPMRPTRDIRMPQFDVSDIPTTEGAKDFATMLHGDLDDTVIDDVSDGVPLVEGHEDTMLSGSL